MREWRRILCVDLLLSLAAGACWRGAKAGRGPLRPREHITRTSLVVTSIRIPTYPYVRLHRCDLIHSEGILSYRL